MEALIQSVIEFIRLPLSILLALVCIYYVISSMFRDCDDDMA